MDVCLEVDSVIKSFGERWILTDVYLCCRPGDIIGLFGRNGTGKSTLLKIIFGTMAGERSFVRINGKVQTRQAFRSGEIAYLPQHAFLPPELKIMDLIDLYLPNMDKKFFLADPFLFKSRNMKTGELAGGVRRYLEIKLILNLSATYVLLAEPFNGLSPIAAESVRQQIQVSSRERGIVLTDHNFREVHKVVNRIMLLDDCYLKEVKKPEELIPFGYYVK
jgi:ABC-type lipopolysaccharide export system ATPase subunit